MLHARRQPSSRLLAPHETSDPAGTASSPAEAGPAWRRWPPTRCAGASRSPPCAGRGRWRAAPRARCSACWPRRPSAVLGQEVSGEPQRVLSLGEAKWGKIMTPGHARRLRRARDLLAVKGYDTSATRSPAGSPPWAWNQRDRPAHRGPPGSATSGPTMPGALPCFTCARTSRPPCCPLQGSTRSP